MSLRFSVAGEGDLSRSAEITRRCNRYLGIGEKSVLDRKMNAIKVKPAMRRKAGLGSI